MAEVIVDGIRFRTVVGFEKYMVGEDGTVLSFCNNRSGVKVTSHKLKPTLSGGYPAVCLGTGDSSTRRRLVHRLVLEAFVGQCPEGMEACHGNGIRTDNRLENLRWDTRLSNHADKRLHGTHPAGEQNPQATLTDDLVIEIKHRIVNGEQSRKIAKDYGVDESTIGKIRTGEHWASVAPELNAKFPQGYPHVAGSISQLAKRAGLSKSTVHARINRGWSIERALQA